jgi:nicotinate-nucleotide adenylyltransferase
MLDSRKIALFGGTFDPVHLGHIHLASLAKDAMELDEVRFLPCRISPHKTGCRPADGGDRCEMLRLATAEIPWAVIDDFELHQAGPSFSYQTAESMAERFPDSQLYWIMGGDQWAALPQWKHPERLARCVEFIVLARNQAIQAREGFRLNVVHGQHPASATDIRRSIPSGAISHEWLNPAVSRWIAEKQLYSGDSDSP